MSYTELSSKTVKGRKVHICSWCGEDILIGEKQSVRSGVFDGEFQSNREHLECLEAMNKVDWNDWDNSYTPHDQKRGTSEQKQYN